MNTRQLTLLSILATVLVATALPAAADGGYRHHSHSRSSVGVYIGAPFGPWVAPPPYYYYPPSVYYPPRVIVVPPPQPPVYIEQAPPDAGNYWYYCQQAGAYYPQVQQCPAGWIRVPPR